MNTPGLEYVAEVKVEHKAYEPSLENVVPRGSSNFQGLELDKRDQDKIPQEQSRTKWPGQARNCANAGSMSCASRAKSALSPRPRGTRKSKFCLIGAIAAILIVTIIAASVAGSLAARKNGSDSQK